MSTDIKSLCHNLGRECVILHSGLVYGFQRGIEEAQKKNYAYEADDSTAYIGTDPEIRIQDNYLEL